MFTWDLEVVRAEVSDEGSSKEQYRLLYAEKFENLKEDIRRLDFRMEKIEGKTDKLHKENLVRFAEVEKVLGSFKVKLGIVYAAFTSVIIIGAQVLMKKFGLL